MEIISLGCLVENNIVQPTSIQGCNWILRMKTMKSFENVYFFGGRQLISPFIQEIFLPGRRQANRGKEESKENHDPQHTERASFCISVCSMYSFS